MATSFGFLSKWNSLFLGTTRHHHEDDDDDDDDEEKKANTFDEEGVSRTGSIGRIWREYDDDDDYGARDRVRRVSRQLLSQGRERFSFFSIVFLSSLFRDVAAECDDDDALFLSALE